MELVSFAGECCTIYILYVMMSQGTVEEHVASLANKLAPYINICKFDYGDLEYNVQCCFYSIVIWLLFHVVI